MIAAMRTTTATVHRAVYCTYHHALVNVVYHNLFITTSMDDHNEVKRTEQSLYVHSSKSEAEVTNNRRLRSAYCTIEANY